MEVTRLRDTPILTFMNKLDRDIRDPMELMDEVETELKIACSPVFTHICLARHWCWSPFYKAIKHMVNTKVT